MSRIKENILLLLKPQTIIGLLISIVGIYWAFHDFDFDFGTFLVISMLFAVCFTIIICTICNGFHVFFHEKRKCTIQSGLNGAVCHDLELFFSDFNVFLQCFHEKIFYLDFLICNVYFSIYQINSIHILIYVQKMDQVIFY